MTASLLVIVSTMIFIAATSSFGLQTRLGASPTPIPDPISSTPHLLLVSAGRAKIRSRIQAVKLSSFGVNRVCPASYPRGLTVRCDGSRDASRAIFFVNGMLSRKEYKMPFYLTANYNGYVAPLPGGYARSLQAGKLMKVVCRLADGDRAEVKLVLGC